MRVSLCDIPKVYCHFHDIYLYLTIVKGDTCIYVLHEPEVEQRTSVNNQDIT